jgi:hypothetical protein
MKRENWGERFDTITGQHADRLNEIGDAVSTGLGLYRRQFRAPKR